MRLAFGTYSQRSAITWPEERKAVRWVDVQPDGQTGRARVRVHGERSGIGALREALACHQEAEDRLGQANDFQILGPVVAEAGELAAAAECASRAQELHRAGGISRRLGDKRGRLRALILRARLEAALYDALAQEHRELLAKLEGEDS